MRSVPRAIGRSQSPAARGLRRAEPSSRARFSSQHVRPPGSPRTPSGAVVGVLRRPRPAPASTSSPGRRRPAAACSRALATEMCGSRPDADAVTASTGTGDVGRQAVLRPVRATRSSTAASRSGLSGPRFEPGARRAVVAGAGRGRPGVEVLRRRRTAGRSARCRPPRRRARRGSRRPGRRTRPGAIAGGDQRVGDPEQHGEHDEGERRPGRAGGRTALIHFTPRAVMTMSMSLMPMNGTTTPPRP